MVENLQIYKDASELIKRVFIIVKQFPRDYKYTIGTRIYKLLLWNDETYKLLQLEKIYCFTKQSKYVKI